MNDIDLNKMFTPKQREVITQELTNPNWKLMINYGAVRAGKTYVDNFVFLFEVRHAAEVAKLNDIKKPLYILAGVSSKSIENNILTELYNTFGLEFKFDKHNSFQIHFDGLPPVTIIQAFTGSISGLSVRGLTATGAYINEAALANEAVFDEIRKRCSVSGARVVCDTNPDVPSHYLKKKYIDNPKHSDSIISNHFRLEDNTYLDPDYVRSLKETIPTGMFYDRAVLGLWVSGEGMVYRDFSEKENMINASQVPVGLEHYAGVDWGFEHKGCILVEGDAANGNTYQVYENTKQYKQIDYWVSVAKKLQAKYGKRMPFYCDSARPDYVSRFRQEGINAINANKKRLSGVEMVAGMYKANKLLIVRQPKNVESKFLDEIYEYVWDETTGEPKKLNDDVMDTQRYAIYTHHHQGAVIKTFRY